MARNGCLFFYTKCRQGRQESRIHTTPLFCTDDLTSGKWDAVMELGLVIEFGLRRAIQSKAPFMKEQVRLDGLLFSTDA